MSPSARQPRTSTPVSFLIEATLARLGIQGVGAAAFAIGGAAVIYATIGHRPLQNQIMFFAIGLFVWPP